MPQQLPNYQNAPNIAFLISGRGSNMMAILRKVYQKNLKINVKLVFSDKKLADGLSKAKTAGIKTLSFSPKEFNNITEYETYLLKHLKSLEIDYIVCAGYMRILKNTILNAYANKIFNVHPSILPSFPGLKAQKQALDYGVKFSGCTIHKIDAGMDTGPIIAQRIVKIDKNETEGSLSLKILKEEHDLYWQALNQEIFGKKITKRKLWQ